MLKIILIFAFVAISVKYSNAVDSTSERYVFDTEALDACVDGITKCNEMYGPFPDIFEFVREGKCSDDENFKKIVHCSYNITGYSYDDGHIKIEEVAKLFPQDSNVLEVMKTCDKETGEDEVETSWKFFKCFQSKSPVNIGV